MKAVAKLLTLKVSQVRQRVILASCLAVGLGGGVQMKAQESVPAPVAPTVSPVSLAAAAAPSAASNQAPTADSKTVAAPATPAPASVPAATPGPAPAPASVPAQAPAPKPAPGQDEEFVLQSATLVMGPKAEPRRVRQPVHEYFTVFDPQAGGRQTIEQKVNPFVAYTNLGTDFGFIGTGQEGIGYETGMVSITMPKDKWGGMWHSLAGLGSDLDYVLDFRACYPPYIAAKYQPKVVGLELRAKGKGTFKVEIKSADQKTVWEKVFVVDSPDMRTFVEALDAGEIGHAKYLNWVAEGGADGLLDSVAFILEMPAIPFDEYVFLASYAKLARCFSMRTAYVKDRAHIRDGYFDNVPACGLFALGTALAAKRGMVSDRFAEDLAERIEDNICHLETARGLLPHFVKQHLDGRYRILPGTEYSTVDTAIYYHSMILAAEILGHAELKARLTAAVRSIGLDDTMLDSEGYVRHGLREDKVTPLRAVWRDWGGETALVLAMGAMTSNPPPFRMASTGRVYDGTGFIAEIQSLFYPDFDDATPDSLTKQNWIAARKTLLQRQKEYFPKHWPDSEAARRGFYGLSAGEARRGMGYLVSGVELPGMSVIHPHYVLMSASTADTPTEVYDVLRHMEEAHLFPPWGMVEHFTKEVDEYLPMLGALNASFECISAYHLMMRSRGTKNELYDACLRNAELRRGASIFYPSSAGVTSFAESNLGSPSAAP